MSQLHPNLQTALSKAELGALLLRTNHSTTQGLKGAVEALKGACDVVKGHLLLQSQGAVASFSPMAPPAAPLFLEHGGPAPEADLTNGLSGVPQEVLAAKRLEAPPTFSPMAPLTEEEIVEFNRSKWEAQSRGEDDLFFSIRLAKPLDEYRRIRDLWNNTAQDAVCWAWFTNELRTGGDFTWPWKCADCDQDTEPDTAKDGTYLSTLEVKADHVLRCNKCGWKHRDKERKAKEKAAAPKAAKTSKTKKAGPAAGGDE